MNGIPGPVGPPGPRGRAGEMGPAVSLISSQLSLSGFLVVSVFSGLQQI